MQAALAMPDMIWSDSGRGQECTLRGHSAAVNSVAFSPDGTRVVSASGYYTGGGDNTVRIWDVASGKEVGATGPRHARHRFGLTVAVGRSARWGTSAGCNRWRTRRTASASSAGLGTGP